MSTAKERATAALAAKRLRGEPLDKIADEIVMISNAVRKIRATGLTERTMLLLIQDAIGGRSVSTKTIKAVLDGIIGLSEHHLRHDEEKSKVPR
jgi:hypothetical protein